MASEGPNFPSTAAEDTSVGTVSWSNYGNVTASDDTRATVALTTETAYYIKATNYGFSIPADATIDGIESRSERFAGTATRIRDGSASSNSGRRIVKGGTISGDNKGTTVGWLTFELDVAVGSSSDLWGLTWTEADINSSTFGQVQSAEGYNGGSTGYVDSLKLTVHYTPAPSGAIQLALTGVGTQ